MSDRKVTEPVLLRIQETARLLSVSTWTIYRWIGEGRLRATKIGRGSLRVFWTSVNELIGKAETNGEMTRPDVRGKPVETRPANKKRR